MADRVLVDIGQHMIVAQEITPVFLVFDHRAERPGIIHCILRYHEQSSWPRRQPRCAGLDDIGRHTIDGTGKTLAFQTPTQRQLFAHIKDNAEPALVDFPDAFAGHADPNNIMRWLGRDVTRPRFPMAWDQEFADRYSIGFSHFRRNAFRRRR